jgi:AcrR family transcriptional regulator
MSSGHSARRGDPSPPAQRYRRSNPGVPRRTLKLSQRERLIDAMTELATRHGYHSVSITDLCAHAGVSPVTFYEQFKSKEACFLAAYTTSGQLILGRMRTLAASGGDWPQTARLALEELLRGLRSNPDAGRLMLIEALGGGPAIAAQRARVIEEFRDGAEEVVARTSPRVRGIDVPLFAVIGALRHVISRHLRTRAEDQLPTLLEDGLRWLESYSVPGGSVPWSSSAAALLEPSARPSPPRAWEPEPLPPGTHGLSPGVVARSQRTRLIFATAEVMRARGFTATKISDIVAAARVARPVFYEHFDDKEDAFLEAQRYANQYMLDRCAQAYFSADEWPERQWRQLRTLLELIAAHPSLSHLRLVESYAAGPKAIRRAEEITRAFTLFLEEGYRYGEHGASLPRLTSQAIAGATFGIIQRRAAEGAWDELPRHLPQLTYIAIAPFTGAERAVELVEDLKRRDADER